MSQIILPIVHANGSGASGLYSKLDKVEDAIKLLQRALANARPHGRDYYLNPEGAGFQEAQAQWLEQEVKLEELADFIGHHAAHVHNFL